MTLIVAFPAPAQLMTLNQRHHWAVRSQLTKRWRNTAAQAAWQIPQPRRQPPATVELVLPVADQRRRDPHNYSPTLKAVIDGLVDAGLWPDDTPEYVRTLEPRLVVARNADVEVHLTPHPDR